jgi:hypothetical protein
MQFRSKSLEKITRSHDVNFHPAVSQIFRVPGQAEPFRRSSRKEAETNSLHVPAHKEALRNPLVSHSARSLPIANKRWYQSRLWFWL